MKLLKALAGAVVAVVMVCGHVSLGRAQGSDAERLRQLEREMEEIRQELETVKKDRMAMESPFKLFSITLGASITVRYDLTDVEDETDLRLENDDVDGFRTRDRFWAVFEPDGPVQAGVRLSTGGDPNPTSPFLRMGDFFRTKSFDLDRFYINVRPVKFFDSRPFADQPVQVSFIAGKMPNPFWTGSRGGWNSELIWDVDVQPEGIALQLAAPKLLPFLGLESTTSYFQIEEVDDFRFAGLTADTYLVATQLRATIPYAILAFTFYNYENLNAGLRSPNFDPGSGAFLEPGQAAILLRSGLQVTNNRVTFGPGAIGFVDETFRVINLAGQVYFPLPLPALAPEIWLFGDYVNNLSVSDDDQGFGITIGLRGGGEGMILAPFNIWFTYRDVDADATLGTFADSDLGAGTGYHGFEFGVNYRFHRHLLGQITVVDFKGFPNKDNDVSRVFFDLVATF